MADEADLIAFSILVPTHEQLTEKGCMEELGDKTRLFLSRDYFPNPLISVA